MYRLFVALDLPEDIRKELSLICYGLPGAKWVKEEQIHITLKFIGEVDGGLFRDIREELDGIKGEPFSLRIKGTGCFPPGKKPHVLWAGLEKSEELNQLKARVDNRLKGLGIEPEKRKFSPHITLARLFRAPVKRVSQFLAGHSFFTLPAFKVKEFHLYSSMLNSGGAIHRIQATYPLSGPE
ncbi:MAG: RNA 2',3'-cyclic phosphodiesterase [Thermodesulfobacteriota bacterium]